MPLPAWAEQIDESDKFSARGNAISGGIAYNMIATVFQMVGSLVSVLLLARLVTVEDFGIYGMVLPVVSILFMGADGGASYFIIRRQKLDQAALSFAFWYTILIGIGLTFLMWLITPLLAWSMDEPRVLEVALVMALSLLFASAVSQPMALVMRCFRNDLRTLVIVAAVSGSLVLGFLVAWMGGGYWAFVTVFVSRTTLMLLLFLVTGWRPDRPRFHAEAFQEIRRLGHVALMARLVLNAVRATDRILVGLLFSTVTTGVYAIAYMVTLLPMLQISTPLLTVFMPYLAEERGDKTRFFDIVRHLLTAMIFLLVPICLMAAMRAEDILTVVLGADKAVSAVVFPMLVMAGVASVLVDFTSMPFQAVDRPDISRRYNLWMAALFVVVLLLAIPFDDVTAIAWAVLIGNLIALVVRFRALCRHFGQSLSKEVRRLLPVLSLSFGIPVLVTLVTSALGFAPDAAHLSADVTAPPAGTSPLARLGLVIALFVPLYAAGGWILFRHDVARLIKQARSTGRGKETGS